MKKNKISEREIILYNETEKFFSIGYIWIPFFRVYKSFETDKLTYLWSRWKLFLFSLIPTRIALRLLVHEYDSRQACLYRIDGQDRYIEIIDEEGSYITNINNKIIEKGFNMKRNLVLHTDKILIQPTATMELGENGPLKEMLDFIKEYRAKGKQIVSLSAPQIGLSKRVFMLVEDEKVRAFINPVIVEAEGEYLSNEGCLNIPNVSGDVLRSKKIRLEYFNENWQKKVEEFSGQWAFIVQHEIDHLDGTMFTKKAINKKFSKR